MQKNAFNDYNVFDIYEMLRAHDLKVRKVEN